MSLYLSSSIDTSSAQSQELQTILVGQIARALAVFCVDEIVVFDDTARHDAPKSKSHSPESYTGKLDPGHFMVHLLQYLEAPPHVRREQFGIHPNLKSVGLLPSLDMPHHKTSDSSIPYFEGIVVKTPWGSHYDEAHRKKARHQDGNIKEPSFHEVQVQAGSKSLVNVQVSKSVPPGTRITLQAAEGFDFSETEIVAAHVVPSDAPRVQDGYYWGYKVRQCAGLSEIFSTCPFAEQYTHTIGTSERGRSVDEMNARLMEEVTNSKKRKPSHVLIVFGGVAGLEVAAKNDPKMATMGFKGPERLFNYWTNLCPGQGSRTIRTEEAVWIGLTALKNALSQIVV
jgi:predicted SPOUT superfamily RNA methylase MTH1